MGHAHLEHLKASTPVRMDLNLDRRVRSKRILIHDQETRMPTVPSFLLPIVLLLISNVFMTFA